MSSESSPDIYLNWLHEQGLLSSTQLQSLTPRVQTLGGQELCQLLLKEGWVTESQLRSLQQAVMSSSPEAQRPSAPESFQTPQNDQAGINQDAVETVKVGQKSPFFQQQAPASTADEAMAVAQTLPIEAQQQLQERLRAQLAEASESGPVSKPGESEPGAEAQLDPWSEEAARAPLQTPQTVTSLEPGQNIGPYSLERQLGLGATSVVWLAGRDGQDRSVALKILPHDADGTDLNHRRFEREISVLKDLNHPHIIKVFDWGRTERWSYMAMEYVPGGSLADHLFDSGRYSVTHAFSLGVKIAKALQYAHKAGILHRDLKPGNVLLGASGEPIVADFGLARQKTLPTKVMISRTGEIVGTPAYMPPELADSQHKNADERADIYSLGATLFALLTGSPPFEGRTVVNIVHAVLQQEPLDAKALRPDLPEPVLRFLRTCLNKEPKQRYPTMDAAIAAMESIYQDAAGEAQGLARSPRVVGALALLCVASLVGLGVEEWLRRSQRRQLQGQVQSLKKQLTTVTEQSSELEAQLQATQKRLHEQWLSEAQRSLESSASDELPLQLRCDLLAAAQGRLTQLGALPKSMTVREKGLRGPLKRLADLQSDPMRSTVGDFGRALKNYQQLIAAFSDGSPSNLQKGRILRRFGDLYWSLGQPAQAREQYQQALTVMRLDSQCQPWMVAALQYLEARLRVVLDRDQGGALALLLQANEGLLDPSLLNLNEAQRQSAQKWTPILKALIAESLAEIYVERKDETKARTQLALSQSLWSSQRKDGDCFGEMAWLRHRLFEARQLAKLSNKAGLERASYKQLLADAQALLKAFPGRPEPSLMALRLRLDWVQTEMSKGQLVFATEQLTVLNAELKECLKVRPRPLAIGAFRIIARMLNSKLAAERLKGAKTGTAVGLFKHDQFSHRAVSRKLWNELKAPIKAWDGVDWPDSQEPEVFERRLRELLSAPNSERLWPYLMP